MATKKIVASDVYPMVYTFLAKSGFSKTAASLLKESKRSEKSLKSDVDLVTVLETFKKVAIVV